MTSVCAMKKAVARPVEIKPYDKAAAEQRMQDTLDALILKMREKNRAIQEARNKHRTIFLKEAPKVIEAKKVTEARCQSRTLDNKPCPFRATCGKYCKRHQI